MKEKAADLELGPKQALVTLLQSVVEECTGQAIDERLQTHLNGVFQTDTFGVELLRIVQEGVDSGWVCKYEEGGIKYGRVVKPHTVLGPYSVDIVYMNDVVGPKHRHPKGEIDFVMPLDDHAAFDGVHRGWKVYEPDSVHSPTVSGGAAYVLYLLPEGAITFE